MKLHKFLFINSIYLFLLPSIALGYCYEPSEPNIPSGYNADFDEIESAESDVEDYISEVEEYIKCLNREAEQKKDDIDDLEDDIDDLKDDIGDLEDDIDDLEDDIDDADQLKNNIINEWNDALKDFKNSQ